jgi:CDK inhibitor PHO81
LKKSTLFISKKKQRYFHPFRIDRKPTLISRQFSLRLKTLLDKKRVIQARIAANSRLTASFVTLVEGFQQFDNDLNKLQVCAQSEGKRSGIIIADNWQQFVEVNETAISKILKKVRLSSLLPLSYNH